MGMSIKDAHLSRGVSNALREKAFINRAFESLDAVIYNPL